jgi:hypothetical protein
MYIIINNTTKSYTKCEGNWPIDILEKQLNKGDRVIVISFYSNTIKVPYSVEYNGNIEWEWESFSFVLSRYKDL